MAATDTPPIIKLGVNDAIAGLVLSVEAHWNQTEEDWRIFLRDGVVFGIRDGMRLVATAALLPYSDNNAWISMVLVSGTHRRRGLATRLVDACLETARKNGLTSWLDATPDGAAVYGPLGFTPILQLRRLKLVNSTQASAPAPSAATLDALCARDRRVTGFDRTALLTAFARRSASRIVAANDASRWSATAEPRATSVPCLQIMPSKRWPWSRRSRDPRPAPSCSTPSPRKARSWKD